MSYLFIYFFGILSSTAAATFRQAVALIFDHVVSAESLPAGKFGSGGYTSRTNSVTSDVNRNIKRLEYELILIVVSYQPITRKYVYHVKYYSYSGHRPMSSLNSFGFFFLGFFWIMLWCLPLFMILLIEHIWSNRLLELEVFSGGLSLKRNALTKPGKLGLCLLEDLTTLAAGGSVCARFEKIYYVFEF